MRRHLTRLAVLVAAGSLLTACGGTSNGEEVAGPATRKITHAMGVAEVPVEPQRVVVLDTGELDDTLALGIKPVGTIWEPNLEKIAALDPWPHPVQHRAARGDLRAAERDRAHGSRTRPP